MTATRVTLPKERHLVHSPPHRRRRRRSRRPHLARVLHLNGIESAVFDLDASPTARTQGGMLDIHEESGQAALRAAGLHEEFRAVIHAGGEAMRILDREATVRTADDGEGGIRPEVDRGVLRDLLLGSCPTAPSAGAPRSPAYGRSWTAATR